MIKLLTVVYMLVFCASAGAFELQRLGAADFLKPAAAAPMQAPAPLAAPEEDWAALRAGFFRAEVPADLHRLIGIYKGYLHPLYEREDYTVPFTMAVYADPVTGAVKAAFPMPPEGLFETVTLKLTPHGAEFADAWGGRARAVIRLSGGKLLLFSNLYSDETYGMAEPAGEPKGQNEYKRLAGAFETGSAPSRDELLAWKGGRVYGKDYPEYPGGLLLAGWNAPTFTLTHAFFKLEVMTVDGNPSFFEKLDPALVPGISTCLHEQRRDWSDPAFTGAGVKFEKLLPPYNKGFSRYEVRKAADGSLVLKHDWKDDLGGSVSSGVDYGALTRDVTPGSAGK
ncbi:MAG: hypothetical protein NTY45_12155 [Elusimicrobia bacterium]|nr:hypothetical protein [Elusimicrobiota bacterium]